VNRSYEALVASWREQAETYVRRASRSSNLRDIVRFIAAASTLEHAARKLGSATDVNLRDIARLLYPVVEPGTHCRLESAQIQSTDSCPGDIGSMSGTCMLAEASRPSETASRKAIMGWFISPQRNTAHARDRIASPTGPICRQMKEE
jgi:hypothetical protein